MSEATVSTPPIPRLTVITLGVADMRRSIAFYEALGFDRKMRATGEAVAFFASPTRSLKSTGNILNVDGGVAAASPR